jgi:hypothetical protein
MTVNELADLGLYLAKTLQHQGETTDSRDYNQTCLLQDADTVRDTANRIRNLVSHKRIGECLLLPQAADLAPAPFEDEVAHFQSLAALFEGFLNSNQSWSEYFDANRQTITELWDAPRRCKEVNRESERRALEAVRLAAERQKEDFAHHLAMAREQFSKPQCEAPCFATTRKNGLNCNRNTLVEIAKLPSLTLPEKRIDLWIKRCAQCWQIYKEYAENNPSTRECFKSGIKQANG